MDEVTRPEDVLSAELSHKRARRLRSQRRAATQAATALDKRGAELAAELAKYDSDAPAPAHLTAELEEIELEVQRLSREIPAILCAEALAHHDEDGEPYFYPFTADELLAWADHAVELECNPPKFGEDLLPQLVHLEQVPNAPFRERLETLLEEEDGEATLAVIARRVDFTSGDEPDTTRVKRVLGMERNGVSVRLFIPYDLGVAFMRALGMTPHQAGV